jgi:hypothetical protein
MLKLTIYLSVCYGLLACSSANLKDSSKESTGKLGDAANPPSAEATPTSSNSSPPNGTGVVTEGTVVNEDSALTPVLGSNPVVPPTIVAGASLSCSLTSANKELRCETKKNGSLIDVKPEATFAVAGNGQMAMWNPLAMEMRDPGVYISPAPALIGQFIVTKRLSANYYLTDLVGTGALPFKNHIKNPSFENNFVLTGSEKDFLASEVPTSLWRAVSNSSSSCAPGVNPLIRIQTNVDGTNAQQPAIDGTKWASLSSRCGADNAAKVGNYSLQQNMPNVTIGNFYHVSFLARADDANTDSPADALLSVHWGLVADTKSITVTPSNEWKRYSMNVWAKSDNVTLDLEEKGVSNGKGTLIDSVMVLDMGTPQNQP